MLDLKGPGHLYCTWICTQYTHTYNSWHMDFAFKEVSIVRYRAFQWLIQSCRHLMINKDNMGFRILFSSVAQHPNAHPVCLSSFSCSYHQVPGRKHLEGYFGSQFEGLVSITVGKKMRLLATVYPQLWAGSEQEVGQGDDSSRPSLSGPLLPARFHFLKIPQVSKAMLPLGTKS